MHYSEVRSSSFLIGSCDPKILENSLRFILQKIPSDTFTYCGPIEGMNHSGRIFAVSNVGGLYPLATYGSARKIAEELMKIVPEARYEPADKGKTRKGWAIHAAALYTNPVAIAYAVWL